MPIQQWSDRIWVVKLADEPALSEDLSMAITQSRASARMPDIVLDLSSVKQVNSTNLSQLLRLRKLTLDRDAQLRMAAPSDTIWAVFLTTGLDKIFEFAQDVPTALASIQMRH